MSLDIKELGEKIEKFASRINVPKTQKLKRTFYFDPRNPKEALNLNPIDAEEMNLYGSNRLRGITTIDTPLGNKIWERFINMNFFSQIFYYYVIWIGAGGRDFASDFLYWGAGSFIKHGLLCEWGFWLVLGCFLIIVGSCGCFYALGKMNTILTNAKNDKSFYYRLNKNAQANGEYEVHKNDCPWYPNANYFSIGQHNNSRSAVNKAKQMHPSWEINGCAHCVPECHIT